MDIVLNDYFYYRIYFSVKIYRPPKKFLLPNNFTNCNTLHYTIVEML